MTKLYILPLRWIKVSRDGWGKINLFQEEKMRTVRDFKSFMEKELGEADFYSWSWSPDYRAFWRKLNEFKYRRGIDDDASVPLSDEEWGYLEKKFHEFRKR